MAEQAFEAIVWVFGWLLVVGFHLNPRHRSIGQQLRIAASLKLEAGAPLRQQGLGYSHFGPLHHKCWAVDRANPEPELKAGPDRADSEDVRAGPNPADLEEEVRAGPNPKEMMAGPNPADSEDVRAGPNPADLEEEMMAGPNPADLEDVRAGPNPADLEEEMMAGPNPADLEEEVRAVLSLDKCSVEVGGKPAD